MSLLGQVDWNGIEGSQPDEIGFDPIPNGTYYFTIKDVGEKPTRSGTGAYVEVVFECLDDAHKGTRVFGRYNLSNPNRTAVNIARKELKALGDALGIVPTGADALVGRVLKLEVAVEKRSDDPSKFTNVIKKYLANGNAPPNPPMEEKAAVAAGTTEAADDPTPF